MSVAPSSLLGPAAGPVKRARARARARGRPTDALPPRMESRRLDASYGRCLLRPTPLPLVGVGPQPVTPRPHRRVARPPDGASKPSQGRTAPSRGLEALAGAAGRPALPAGLSGTTGFGPVTEARTGSEGCTVLHPARFPPPASAPASLVLEPAPDGGLVPEAPLHSECNSRALLQPHARGQLRLGAAGTRSKGETDLPVGPTEATKRQRCRGAAGRLFFQLRASVP